jgi:hypothetical protein
MLNQIWEAMIDLHKKTLTIISKNTKSCWNEKVEEFY